MDDDDDDDDDEKNEDDDDDDDDDDDERRKAVSDKTMCRRQRKPALLCHPVRRRCGTNPGPVAKTQ